MSRKPKHPMQPIMKDTHGVVRFSSNAIVKYLLDAGHTDLNKLACMPFTDADRSQFAQLIGYSVSGFGDLGYACRRHVNEADALAAALLKAMP